MPPAGDNEHQDPQALAAMLTQAFAGQQQDPGPSLTQIAKQEALVAMLQHVQDAGQVRDGARDCLLIPASSSIVQATLTISRSPISQQSEVSSLIRLRSTRMCSMLLQVLRLAHCTAETSSLNMFQLTLDRWQNLCSTCPLSIRLPQTLASSCGLLYSLQRSVTNGNASVLCYRTDSSPLRRWGLMAR